MIQVNSMVWHPKTKLVGRVAAVAQGETFDIDPADLQAAEDILVPAGHALILVDDVLGGEPHKYVWALASLELLDEEEYKLVAELNRCRKLKTELNKQVKEAQAAYGAADEAMLKYLDRMAIRGTREYAGVGQVSISGVEVHASISEENKPLAFEEIRKMGRGEIIKETIHPSTLDAFVSECKDTGVPVPAHVSTFERPKFSFAKKK